MSARLKKLLAVVLFIGLFSMSAFAAYPQKPVTIIVPWSPGGSTDIIARGLTEPFQRITSQSLVIVNKPGGASTVGMTEALTYKPDGYTLVLNASCFAVGHHLGQVSFDYTAFDNICNISSEPLCFVVKKDNPWNNMLDMIAYAKENPGAVTVGIGGAGSLAHITTVGVQNAAEVQLTIVPFEGNAPAKAAMLGGHVSIATMHPSEFISQYKAGEVKVLGVITDKRSTFIPEAPTLIEQGIDFAWDDSRWIAAPKGLPRDVLERLRHVFKEAVEDQSFKQLSKKMNFEINFYDGEKLDNTIKALFDEVEVIVNEVK